MVMIPNLVDTRNTRGALEKQRFSDPTQVIWAGGRGGTHYFANKVPKGTLLSASSGTNTRRK